MPEGKQTKVWRNGQYVTISNEGDEESFSARDKEKFQDTSPLVAAAAREKKKREDAAKGKSTSPAPAASPSPKPKQSSDLGGSIQDQADAVEYPKAKKRYSV